MSFVQEMLLTSLRKMHTEHDLRPSHFPIRDNKFCDSCNTTNTPHVIVDSQPEMRDRSKQSCVDYPHTIDKYSRALFPLVFIVFNCIYWSTYLTISTRDDLTEYVL